MQKLYKVLLSLSIFTSLMLVSNNILAQDIDFTLPVDANPAINGGYCTPPNNNPSFEIIFDPLPDANGTYQPGQVIDACITFLYNGSGANWLHGVVLGFPEGFDETNLSNMQLTMACGSTTNIANWSWYPNGVLGLGADNMGVAVGPGWFYDDGNGNPADNWGQNCAGQQWEVCFTITLEADCGGAGNPADNTTIIPAIAFYGDGDTGDWIDGSDCLEVIQSDDFNNPPTAELNCCDADAGISPGTLPICENGTICLFDILLGNPEAGGIWTGPPSWTPDACGTFDPTSDPPGDYSYSVFDALAGCSNTTTITFEFLDIGQIGSDAHCDGGIYDLNVFANDAGIPTNGTWYYPPTVFGGAAIPLGLFDTDAPGVGGGDYEYEFYDASNCFTTATANLIFSTGGASGTETWIDLCTEEPSFCPFDFLTGTPAPGGQWIVYDQAGNFLEFHTTYDVCLTPSDANYASDFYLTYALNNPPCPPAFTDLHVTVYNLANTGLATTTSICVTDAPVLVESLLTPNSSGPVDVGLNWTELSMIPGGQPAFTNPLDPSLYLPNTEIQLLYEGGYPNSPCVSSSVLTLNILPANANAGLPGAIDICETDAPVDMFSGLQNDPGVTPPEPQIGGSWTDPLGNPHNNFYNPAIDGPGVYTYTVTSSCDADVSTVTINEIVLPDAGIDNASIVCETNGNVNLTAELGGTPIGGGTWTEQGTGNPIADPFDVTGLCGTTFNFTYTVVDGPCTNSADLSMTVECAPDAGPPVTETLCGDGTIFNLFSILDPGADPGGVFSPSSTVALLPVNSQVFTYTVSGTACAPDVANYTLNIVPQISATSVTTTCELNQTEYVVTIELAGGTPGYTVTGMSGGTMTTATTFVSNPIAEGTPYNFNVSDTSPCGDLPVGGASPACPCLATTEFTSANTVICQGSCTNLTATSSGVPPFTVQYTDGVNPPVTVILNTVSELISVCPSATTTYSIVSVEDANCVGTPGAGTTTIGIETPPNAGPDLPFDYCGDGSTLNLNTILDPAADLGGVWTPNSSVVLLPGNAGLFTYTVSGGGNCPADVAAYTINIDPEITTTAPVTNCTPDQLEYIVSFDILTGVPGAGYTVSGPYSQAPVGNTFTSLPIPAGTPFNFTVSDNGTCGNLPIGGASPPCVCTATTEITSGNVTICEGSCTDLEFINSSGVLPFTVEYSDGTNTYTEVFNTMVGTVNVCPTATTTYSLLSVSDANCIGTTIGIPATITIEPQPNAGPDVPLAYCGDGTNLDLNTVLDISADLGGVWSPSSIVNLIPANAGIYTYTVNGAVCPSDDAVYNISIEEVLSTTGQVVDCEPNETEYTVVFDIAGGDGVYSVTDNIAGNPGSLIGNTYSSNMIPSGTAYNFTVSSTGLCPDIVVSGISPNCNCAATASFGTGNVTICEGGSTGIEILTSGNGPFNVGINDGSGPSTIGPLVGPSDIYTVSPLTTTTYTLVSVADANCTGTAFGSVTVTIETQLDAGIDVTLPTICGDGALVNLATMLDPSADVGGSFTPSGSFPATPGASGIYTYTVTGTECPDDQADYTVNIDAELAITGLIASCLPNQTDYVVTGTITGGTLPYVVDPLEGSIVGDQFTSIIYTVGNPYAFTISDSGPCADLPVNGPTANCNCAATSSFITTNTTICEGSCTNIEIDNIGTGPFTVVYNNGLQDITLSNQGVTSTISPCPTATTTYTLVSVSDVNCVGNAFGSVTVSVDQQMNAGSPVSLTFCDDGTPINLYNYLAADADPGGTFDNPSPTISGIYTYTVGGNECPDDQALYNVTFDELISTSVPVGLCESNQLEYGVDFTISPAVGSYTVTGTGILGSLNIGPGNYDVSITDIIFADDPVYSYTITANNSSCPPLDISFPAPDCNCIAQGSFSGSTTICSGDGADIIFTGNGDGDFDITYEVSSNPGVAIPLLGISSGQIIPVFPTTNHTYTLLTVSDEYCDGVVSGFPVTINVDQPVVVNSTNEVIDANYETYQVVIGLSGGNPLTYNFSPAGGVFDNISNSYTSAPIPCGNGYNITIGDGGVCPPVQVQSAGFDCGCISNSGTIGVTPTDVCIDGTVTATHSGNEVMDGNDILEFILHDGGAGSIGNVIARTYDGVFNMSSYPVNPDQTYCIVSVVGTSDFSGHVILGDDCTSISDCFPVTIKPLPTATIIGGAAVCPGETVDISLQFTGTGPWNYAYAINGGADITGTANTNTEIITTAQPGDYTLVSVEDAFCVGTVAGLATVQNHVTPTATMGGDPEVCEDSGDGPEITFTGVGPWTFEYTIDGQAQAAVTTNSSFYTLPADQSGMYVITSLTDFNCTGSISGNLNVTIISRPTAMITGGGEVCDGDMLPFVVTFTGETPWNATYTVDGVAQSPIYSDSPTYQFDSGIDGDYAITLVNDDKCVGDVLPSDAALVVNPIPSAELEASTTSFCIGEEIELTMVLDGVPPFDVTYVLNNDTTVISGLLASTSQFMSPEGPVTAEILYIEDGSNPTCATTPFSGVYVDAGTLPNAPVLEDDSLCVANGPIRIGVTSAPGLSYKWTPEDNLDDPTSSDPLFTPSGGFGPIAQTVTYVVDATDGNCSATDTMTIKVDPGPTARFAYTPDPVLSEDTEVFFNNYTIGTDAVVYFWEFDSLGTSQQENPVFKFPEGINTSYNITLTAIDANSGCMDVTTELLEIQPEMLIYIPNAFTPDGDAINDLWGPVMQNVDPDNYHLTIFDRLGNIVFESSKLGEKWNGSINDDGHYGKEGVYVWMIETKNSISLEEVEFKGTVTMVR